MDEIFRLRFTNRTIRSQYRLKLDIPKVNQVSFGNKSIRYFGPKIWNSLPPHIKSNENLETFKTVIKNWDGITCNCRVCKSWPSKLFQKLTEAILTLRKIQSFNLILWCGNFVERQSFHIVSGDLTETMQKLCHSTKFPHKEIR